MTQKFEIRIKGHLDSNWSDWLDGVDVTPLDSGETLLSGAIADQAALMGILNKLNRLNLAILAVSAVNAKESRRAPTALSRTSPAGCARSARPTKRCTGARRTNRPQFNEPGAADTIHRR